ncbi:MAG: Zn-dependent oligopeptidase [Myxococcales bacterium]|nr:Zn-dependent oligopeptidase [Myxococcales bacterium]
MKAQTVAAHRRSTPSPIRHFALVAGIGCVGLAGACSGASQELKETTPKETQIAPEVDAAKEEVTAVQNFEIECLDGLNAAKKALPALLSLGGVRDQENFLIPYNLLLVDVERSAATASLMNAVHPDEAIRSAAQKCEQETSSFITELSLHRGLFDAFATLDTKNFDTEAKRLVERSLRDYRRAGVDKDEATRIRLMKIDESMVKLGQEFGKNIVDDVRQIEVAAADLLKGLPEDYIRAHAPNADGKIIITTEYPDLIPFLRYAEDDGLRKELYIANKNRAGESNEKTLREILTLRAEKATILGYANWADYVTEDKMMKSGKKASEFINRVVKTADKRSKRDYKELLAWKKKNMDRRAKSVEAWQSSFIENKVKSESYSFDTQEVRPYFKYEEVQKGLLDVTSKMYGIEYKPAADVELWHEDVSAYEVMQGGKKIGRIFLDMHPRDGKYGHAAQFTYRSGVAGVQAPEGVLVCNFPNPRTSEGAALMEHAQVTTMFHEFGHLMHHVLGGQRKWIQQSGVATEWDFVEAPSQMFEEWAWDHEILSGFAKHHKTGQVIPKEMVERMRRADTFGVGIRTIRQMVYASVSLEFHQADPTTLDMGKKVRSLTAKLSPFPFVEGTKFHSSFGHLNGYSAIYYTYMWSMVIAKDLFTPFDKNGLMNEEWTHKYRDTVLGAGGTKDAAELVSAFLGRDFNYEAFEKYLRK